MQDDERRTEWWFTDVVQEEGLADRSSVASAAEDGQGQRVGSIESVGTPLASRHSRRRIRDNLHPRRRRANLVRTGTLTPVRARSCRASNRISGYRRGRRGTTRQCVELN
jgi:hypothetical protein